MKSPVSTAWPVLYAQSFKKAHVYNYAISGATTFSVKDYQLKFFWDDSKKFDLDSEYKLIFLWIGSNDVKKLFDPIVFQQNYEAIVDQLMSIPNKDLILMTIPDASKLPVAVGSGITEQNIDKFKSHADALIVGSWIKKDGDWKNEIDAHRLKILIEKLHA